MGPIPALRRQGGRRQCSEAPRRLVRRESGQVAAREARSAWDSRGRSIIMRVPQTTGRVRRGPGQALRAVFTGIGQMFLAADRLKEQVESAADAKSSDGTSGGWSHESARVAGGKAAPGQTAPGQTAGRADRSRRSASAGAGTAAHSRWRSLDTTGNVRL